MRAVGLLGVMSDRMIVISELSPRSVGDSHFYMQLSILVVHVQFYRKYYIAVL